jgi:SAM-dependent methyltransferase
MGNSDSNFEAARAFVDFGLQQKKLGLRQSASGPGSNRAAATPCLGLLDDAVVEFGVRSILDLGCGDWNWMRDAKWRENPNIVYEGWEAHEGLVSDLSAQFGDDRTRFRVADAVVERFPQVDLIICRDVLFHMNVTAAENIIHRIKANCGLLLATSYLKETENIGIKPYLPIPNWGFYLINLDISPFDLRKFRIRTVYEPISVTPGRERSACIFDFRAQPRL